MAGYMVRHESDGITLYVYGENGTGLGDRDRADVYPDRESAQWAAQWAAEDTRKRHTWWGFGSGKCKVTLEEVVA